MILKRQHQTIEFKFGDSNTLQESLHFTKKKADLNIKIEAVRSFLVLALICLHNIILIGYYK